MLAMPTTKRQPPPRPRGRPVLPEEERRSLILKVRATQAEADKFERLGGAEWFRQVLKRAKEPR